jgi:hypothetical protein
MIYKNYLLLEHYIRRRNSVKNRFIIVMNEVNQNRVKNIRQSEYFKESK